MEAGVRVDVPAQIKTDHATPRLVAYVAIVVWLGALAVCLPGLERAERAPRAASPLRFLQPPEGLLPSRRIDPRRPTEDVVAQKVAALTTTQGR